MPCSIRGSPLTRWSAGSAGASGSGWGPMHLIASVACSLRYRRSIARGQLATACACSSAATWTLTSMTSRSSRAALPTGQSSQGPISPAVTTSSSRSGSRVPLVPTSLKRLPYCSHRHFQSACRAESPRADLWLRSCGAGAWSDARWDGWSGGSARGVSAGEVNGSPTRPRSGPLRRPDRRPLRSTTRECASPSRRSPPPHCFDASDVCDICHSRAGSRLHERAGSRLHEGARPTRRAGPYYRRRWAERRPPPSVSAGQGPVVLLPRLDSNQ